MTTSQHSITLNFSRRSEALMSLREAFRASLSRCLEPGWELPTHDSYGSVFSKPLARLDLNSSCSKMFPDFSQLEHPMLAYAAGIIDGEGCITASWSNRKRHVYPSIQVGMSVKGEPIIQWLHRIFGGKIYRYERKSARATRHSAEIKWAAFGPEAVSILKKVIPALILKKNQAETAIQLQALIESHKVNGRACWTTSLKKQASEIAAKLNQMNAKGPAKPVWVTDQIMLDGSQEEFSGTWPRSGMMVGGMLFRPQPLEPVIGANDSASYLPTPTTSKIGSDLTMIEPTDQRERPNKLGQAIGRHFLPTPRASANESRQTKLTPSQEAGEHGLSLQAKVISEHFLPTPTTRDYKDTPRMALEAKDGRLRDDQLPPRVYQTCAGESPAPIGGMRLSLEFQCWFQGYPVDWLKPLICASEILSFHPPGFQLRKRSTRNSKKKTN